MAKTKRLLMILLMAVLSVMLAFCAVACGGDSSDDAGNGDQTQNDNNTGNNGTVVYTITEAEFNAAALDSAYVNYKSEISNVLKVNGETVQSNEAVYTLTENAMKFEDPNGVSYFEKASDGYYCYAQVEGVWQKISMQQEQYEFRLDNIKEMTSPASSISGYGMTYSALTYNETEKCYTYASSADGSPNSGVINIYFENAKIVKITMNSVNSEEQKEISAVVVYSYDNISITFPSVGGSSGEQPGGGNEDEHVCNLQAVEWFDANHHYAKKLECSCGENTETRQYIKITNAQELSYISQDFAAGNAIGSQVIEIVNDIDMSGINWVPLRIEDLMLQKTTIRGADDGVTLSNLRVNGVENAGLVGEVVTDLEINNITLHNANINGTNAGALIGKINIADGAKSSGNVVIKDCVVSSCTIEGAVGAGGIYGVAENFSSEKIVVMINTSAVNNSTISCTSAAGAIAGVMTDLYTAESLEVKVSGCSFVQTTISSSTANEAGLLVGIIGMGWGDIDQDSTESAYDNVTAGASGSANTDVYGRTGWASENQKGSFKFGAARTLYYNEARH